MIDFEVTLAGQMAVSLAQIVEARTRINQVLDDLLRPPPYAFAIGQRVKKVKGSYRLSGEIVARWRTDDNQPRYVVDHKPAAPGLLHIYNEKQLAPEKV